MALVAFPNTILNHFSMGPIDITELRSAIDWIDEYLKTLNQLFNQDQPLTDIAISDFLNIN